MIPGLKNDCFKTIKKQSVIYESCIENYYHPCLTKTEVQAITLQRITLTAIKS